MTVEAYTGVHGVLLINEVPVADVTFSIKIERGVAEADRLGKYSAKKYPGKVNVTGTIDEIVTDGELLGMAVGETSITGTAVALHAGMTPPGAGSSSLIAMSEDDCVTPSQIEITALTEPVTGAGTAIIYGTGANGKPLSEVVAIPVMAAGDAVRSSRKFLTVEHITLVDVVQADGTLKVDSVAGGASVTVGAAKHFDLVGKLEQGLNHITIVADNCFLTSGEISFQNADTIVRNPAAFTMRDPDADFEVTYA